METLKNAATTTNERTNNQKQTIAKNGQFTVERGIITSHQLCWDRQEEVVVLIIWLLLLRTERGWGESDVSRMGLFGWLWSSSGVGWLVGGCDSVECMQSRAREDSETH